MPNITMQNVTIFRDKDRYAGWPANYGIWSWGDEIVVNFVAGFNDTSGEFHTRDKGRPFTTMQARSLDGGQTWDVRPMPCRSPGGRGLSADEHVNPELSAKHAIESGMVNAPAPCPGGIDFSHPDFALMCARTGLGGGTSAWFYTSYDRCHTWDGPFSLPMFGQSGIEARTDYLVSSAGECTLMLTATGAKGEEGHGVFCARTSDGGRTFSFVSWITQVAEGFAIMPASVRLSPGRIVTAVRCRGAGKHTGTIDMHVSEDNGATWRFIGTPVANTGFGGNPPAMIRLQDGRLGLVYGYRDAPFGIRARLSTDGGATWQDEIILRSDGGNHDLGYPRIVQRPDGAIVSVYYYNDDPAGERYIAATLWRP